MRFGSYTLPCSHVSFAAKTGRADLSTVLAIPLQKADRVGPQRFSARRRSRCARPIPRCGIPSLHIRWAVPSAIAIPILAQASSSNRGQSSSRITSRRPSSGSQGRAAPKRSTKNVRCAQPMRLSSQVHPPLVISSHHATIEQFVAARARRTISRIKDLYGSLKTPAQIAHHCPFPFMHLDSCCNLSLIERNLFCARVFLDF